MKRRGFLLPTASATHGRTNRPGRPTLPQEIVLGKRKQLVSGIQPATSLASTH